MHRLLTLSEAVATHARLRPAKLGARDSRRTLTYAQWDERASRLANAMLSKLGLAPGDRVAVLAYNRLEWLEIYAGLARAGLVVVPINFRLVGPEITYIVGHCEARALIVQAELRDRIESIDAALAIEPRRRIQLGGAAPPSWQGYEALLGAASPTAPTAPTASTASTASAAFRASVASTASTAPTPPALPGLAALPQGLAALMYTSGTTGRPKGALRSHGGNALIALVTALEFGLTREDTGLLVMPLCHANSLYFALTFATLGATIVVDDHAHFDPEALLATLARERITFTSLVPTHYIMMLGLPAAVKARHDVSAVGKLLISSAPARRDTKLAILEHFRGCRLFELYGSTEAGWVTVLRPDEQLDHLGSVGREWVGSGPIRLLDPEGREVSDGEVGELFSRTPWVFDGYWKNPQKTADAFRGAWCSVGDLARRDEQGFIHLVDRKSNMIISGGENIYPSEVEGVLGAHPAVQDVAVIGMPDATWGESVRAVVVLHPGRRADAATEAELIDWCRTRLAGYKRPRSVSFIAAHEMPRTATGKTLHRQLRDRMIGAGQPSAA